MATCEHSSGVAKAGLTTGIIGTSLAGLWALGAGNGNGLLGGLFGGNCNGGIMAAQGAYQAALSAKDAEIGQLEAERRECGDHRLFEYVNCNYIKAQKKISKDDICPEVMPRWNSWTAPTTEAPAVQPVTGSIKVTR